MSRSILQKRGRKIFLLCPTRPFKLVPEYSKSPFCKEAEKQNALREVNKLRNTFAKHDLDNLALNKPKLVEKMVNRGTKRVIDNLVTLTTVKDEVTN